MKRPLDSRFLCFLEKELSLPADAIALAIGHHHEALISEDLSLLPITLWKHRLVTIDQVGSMFDWLINVRSPFSPQSFSSQPFNRAAVANPLAVANPRKVSP